MQMKAVSYIFNSIFVFVAAGLAGCAIVPRTVSVSGQILVDDGGKIQPTGRAPVWIYDGTDPQFTTKIPVPTFGGRSRDDWKRIVTDYPNSLAVYSNYEALVLLPPAAEIKRLAKAQEYHEKLVTLNSHSNSPDLEAVKRLGMEWKKLLAEEDRLWDEEDDMGELIVFWYNINPGILYTTGLPQPLATTQTDSAGRFLFTIPKGKPVLIATHIYGTIDGEEGNYFWLQPVGAAHPDTNVVVLNGGNARRKRTQARMPQVILPETDGFIGNVSFWSVHRLRDDRVDTKSELP